LAIADIRAAADVLRVVYERTQGRDGYISLECSPYLANDTEATVAKALRLWAAVKRPHTQTLTGMRTRIRDKTRAATCLGFGPRFQHSTGPAYKGGPKSGVFLQITCDDPADIKVPGRSYSFGARIVNSHKE
jgi:hypothetical protein